MAIISNYGLYTLIFVFFLIYKWLFFNFFISPRRSY